jgi:hypothetical protein
MSTEKIDAKLRQEIERLERSGTSAQRLPVIIEQGDSGNVTGARDVAAMEKQVRAAQGPLLKRLGDMGVRNVQQLILANAVAADLTPDQIRDIASEPAVKRIIWNVAERVTL